MLQRILHTISLVLIFVASTTAQILTSGNSQLPICAQSCSVFNTGVTTCNGASTASLATWSCFCSYVYSAAPNPAALCSEVCTDPTQEAEVMTWWTSNCGSDNGASEHAATTAGGATTTTGTKASGTSTSTAVSTGNSNLSDHANPDGTPVQQGGWWANHYQWVIMIIVIFVVLALLTWLLIWLKRRHDRRQDRAPAGFNQGITMRSTPMVSTAAMPVPMQPSSGRDSPARTRDAFMPYGYGYARSESRLGSRTNVADQQMTKSSPLAHDGTTATDVEKTGHGTPNGKKKRIYVREKSMNDINDLEKR